MFTVSMGRCKLILLFLSFWVGVGSAQDVLTGRYNMECLDLAAGLPHNHVNQIWVGTRHHSLARPLVDGLQLLHLR